MTGPDPGWPAATAPPLARSALDRAGHRRTDDAWLAGAWARARVVVVDVAHGGRALVREDPAGTAELVLLAAADAPAGERSFMGVDADGTPVFMVDAALPEVAGARPRTLRDVGERLGDRDAGLFTAAAALGNWHASHRFSPRTGQPTRPVEGGWARADPDGKLMWPRTDPAMIVVVHDGVPGPAGRCLLGHNVAWPASDTERRYSCLAGFVEPGESAEAAVAREVAEEVGLAVGAVRYEGSQAWPYPGSLMLGFSAVADPGAPLRLQPDEIDEARWFTRPQVAAMAAGTHTDPGSGLRLALPMRASIAYHLIERWRTGADPAGPTAP